MKKYRALVGFAGSILSMYAGEVKEISDNVADEFIKIGYIVPISDSEESDMDNVAGETEKNKNDEENNSENTDIEDTENKEKSKTKNTTKRREK